MIQCRRCCSLQTALHRPVEDSAEEPDDPKFRDADHCGAALYRPDVKSAAESDNPESDKFGDPALCRAALQRPDVKSAANQDKPDSGDTAPYRAALHRPVVEAAEAEDDLEFLLFIDSSSQTCHKSSKGSS